MVRRTGGNEVFAPEFSIADLAFYPRVATWAEESLPLTDYPNVLRWRDAVARRPAIQRGWAQPKM